MSHAIECVVKKDPRMNGFSVIFSSKFHDDYCGFLCYEEFGASIYSEPSRSFDKEEAELLRDWLNVVLHNYDTNPNLCEKCFKALPNEARLDGFRKWVVTCENCLHQHEICKNE